MLRGGVLAAAMMTAIPAWARFDPISIVSGSKTDDDPDAEEISEAEQMKEFIQSANALVTREPAQ